MKQLNEYEAELVSALADGRLQGDHFQQAVALASDSEAGRLTWHAYQVVGDTLRSTELADCQRDADFLLRLRDRLAQEPGPAAVLAVYSDVPAVVAGVAAIPTATDAQERRAAAPASNTRWKLVAGLASVAAVAAIGWQWTDPAVLSRGVPPARLATNQAGDAPGTPGAGLAATVVAAPAVVPVAQATADAGAQPVMLRDPRLDELLAAHRQFGGTSALQMPAGFLRNATFERPER